MTRGITLALPVLLTLGGALVPSQVSAAGGALTGTYLQLTEASAGWDDDRWRALFADLERLGVRELVVQWTLYDQTAFYESRVFRSVPDPPLDLVLELADAASMSVLVGLAHDPGYWQKIDRSRDAGLVDVSLRRLQVASLAVARELQPMLERHPSFRGWYLPEEIDDVSWVEEDRRRLLFTHLRRITQKLEELTPGKDVAISGFSNAATDPVSLGELWRQLVLTTGIRRILFQDGIGVGKLELEYVELYLAALGQATARAGGELQVVVELFEQVDGAPLNDRPFRAVPARLERIERQLEAAAPHSQRGIVAFSVPDYLTPAGGEEAAASMRRWLATH